jgi:UDP-glucose 4-epimerase
MNVLVVGGAGYIGSHCVRQLIVAGHRPVVLDNLVFGHRPAVAKEIPFYDVNLGDEAAVGNILEQEKIDLVMHFAAYAYVGESVTDPLKYYFNNVSATLHLLHAMLAKGVTKFVFSSTCATYGIPEKMPIVENLPQSPINPYGQTKLDIENALKSIAHAHGLSFAAFRYFNAAGAAEDGSIGEDHDPETHLIPVAIAAAQGKAPALKIFGTDYPTPDGTCLRDYVHVDDLARAHIAVFEKLSARGGAYFYNLGTGTPTSVREVISAVESATPRRRSSGALCRFLEGQDRARLETQIHDHRSHCGHRVEMALISSRRLREKILSQLRVSLPKGGLSALFYFPLLFPRAP